MTEDIIFGTYQITTGDATTNAIRLALEAGFRKFDNAAVYGNEKYVGLALEQSTIAREQVVVQNKLWNTKRGFENTLKACCQSLKRSRLSYFDNYLIHWPASPLIFPDWQKINNETWRAMEKLQQDGYVRQIGVSNFSVVELMALQGNQRPQVLQSKLHAGHTDLSLERYAAQNHISLQAYSPLGSGELITNQQVVEIAQQTHASAAQVLLAFCRSIGATPITKTTKFDRMRENLGFDSCVLSDEQIQILRDLAITYPITYNPDEWAMRGIEQ